jgi:hypothetical protein
MVRQQWKTTTDQPKFTCAYVVVRLPDVPFTALLTAKIKETHQHPLFHLS